MNTFTKLSAKKTFSIGATLLIATFTGSVCAEESDMTQTRTQDRIRTEFNLQTPAGDSGQAHNREQKMVINKNQNQNQHQYRYMKNLQTQDGGTVENAKSQQNSARNSWQGNTGARSMNRQSGASRSMGGGRR